MNLGSASGVRPCVRSLENINGRDVHLVIDTDIESAKDVQLNRYYWKMLREFAKFCGHSEIELHEYFLSKEGVKKTILKKVDVQKRYRDYTFEEQDSYVKAVRAWLLNNAGFRFMTRHEWAEEQGLLKKD